MAINPKADNHPSQIIISPKPNCAPCINFSQGNTGCAESFIARILENKHITEFMQALKIYSHNTFEHSIRVAHISYKIGSAECLDEHQLITLSTAALLHDYGKTKIPINIIHKAGSLNALEENIIRAHPRLGFNELSEPYFEDVRKIVVAHHEYKTNPYPRSNHENNCNCTKYGRRQNNCLIGSCAQIIAAADIYDALTNPRSYKPGVPEDTAKKMLTEQFKGDSRHIAYIFAK